MLCNFDEFWVYDFDQQLDAPKERISVDQLPQRWDALAFLLPEPLEPVFGIDLVEVPRGAAAKVVACLPDCTNAGLDRDDTQRFVLQSVVAGGSCPRVLRVEAP